jgi:phospholipid/cholesterol/gamma-HCH transport system substrate-binding protein
MTTRTQRRRRRAIALGSVVVAFFVGLLVLAYSVGNGLPFADRTTVKAAFVDVGSLRTGDDVRIANVRVGYVSKIELADAKGGTSKQPVATLKLDGARPVYKNAKANTASVGARSALGQKFIELNPGDPSAGLLPPDTVIPPSDTVGAQEISDLFAVLDQPTRQAIGSTLRNVGGGLAGHSDDLHALFSSAPDLLPDLGTVSDSLSNNNGRDFASLLHSANDLSVAFKGRQQQIGQLLGKLDKTFAGLNADNGQALAATLKTAPESLRQTRTALQSLDVPLGDTAVATRDLLPGGQSLGQATPDVRGVFTDGRAPLDKVPGVSDDAVPALGDLKDVAHDARPLAPMLNKTFGRGGHITQVIAPYMPEVSQFFTNVADALKEGNDNYHVLHVGAVLAPSDATSPAAGVIRDPFNSRDAYPAPNEAPKQFQGAPSLTSKKVTGR